MGGYAEFKSKGKAPITSDDIGPGQIKLLHLDPALFSDFQKIGLHNHAGVGSRRIKHQDLEGGYGKSGFIMRSNDGTKRYAITIDNTGTLIATEI